MEKRTIGRLAMEADVGVETIRYYERSGLLQQPLKNEQGWREYGESAVWTIRYIRLAQQLGFRLRELKQLLAAASNEQGLCQSIRANAREKLQECVVEMEKLQRRRKNLEEFIATCVARPESEGCPIARNLGIRLPLPQRRS